MISRDFFYSELSKMFDLCDLNTGFPFYFDLFLNISVRLLGFCSF